MMMPKESMDHCPALLPLPPSLLHLPSLCLSKPLPCIDRESLVLIGHRQVTQGLADVRRRDRRKASPVFEDSYIQTPEDHKI
jgi:hypothetical protein